MESKHTDSKIAVRLTSAARMIKALGPGILLAGAAIGGSHIVQSTQAGAIYGFALLWAVILSNLFKYPFFEYVFRYHHATGKSMMDGYHRLGGWALWTVQGIVLINGILSYAGVTIVTGALSTLIFPSEILGRSMGMVEYTLFWQVVSLSILIIGNYPWLDFMTKLITSSLAVATIIAVGVALVGGGAPTAPDFIPPEVLSTVGIGFLIALMGWMPAPIDVGIWPSLWAEERERQTGYKPERREMLIDFHIGYIGTAVLGIFFLLLGALVIYGTGADIEKSGAGFSRQLVSMYTEAFGPTAYWLVAIAAVATMFSTSLTCMDGFPRTADRGFQLGIHGKVPENFKGRYYWILIGIYVIFTMVVAYRFDENLTGYVAIAMIVSFITAPFMAILNQMVVRQFLPEEHQPPRWMNWLAYCGIVFLSLFTLLFVYTYFFWDS